MGNWKIENSPFSCNSSVTWLAGKVKEPTHLSKRVGHVVPGVVVNLSWARWVIKGVISIGTGRGGERS